MPTEAERNKSDLPARCDSIAHMFGLPPEQRHEPQHTAPTAPQRSSRLHAILSWLWEFMLEGFATYGLSMYPCFADPSDMSDVLGLAHHATAEPEAEPPAEPSPSQFEAPSTITTRW
jgi:hypothetical protein